MRVYKIQQGFFVVDNTQQIENEIQQSLETMEKSAFPVKPGETFYLKVRLRVHNNYTSRCIEMHIIHGILHFRVVPHLHVNRNYTKFVNTRSLVFNNY